MELVELGRIVDSFGLCGDVKILSSTSFADKRYQIGNHVILENPKTKQQETLTVIAYRNQLDIDIVRFNEINTKEDALAKKGYLIKAEKDLSLLNKNEFYYSDLESCKVIDQDKKELGTVIKVEEFPAQVTLRVKSTTGKEFFVPFVKAFIRNVNIFNKTIEINVIEGML